MIDLIIKIREAIGGRRVSAVYVSQDQFYAICKYVGRFGVPAVGITSRGTQFDGVPLVIVGPEAFPTPSVLYRGSVCKVQL